MEEVMEEKAGAAPTPREQAEAQIREWAEYLEIDTDDPGFQDVIAALVMPVMKERLTFDKDEECFRYRLIKPITYANNPAKEILEIRELDLKQKKAVQRYKDNEKIDMLTALYGRSAGLMIGETEQLKGRDVTVITAIVTGFFS